MMIRSNPDAKVDPSMLESISGRIVGGYLYDPRMMFYAIMEIADYLGDSGINPKFLCVFNLLNRITWEEHEQIVDTLYYINRNKEDYPDFLSVKAKLLENVPILSELDNHVIATLIKLYAQKYVSGLYEFSQIKLLDYEYKVRK